MEQQTQQGAASDPGLSLRSLKRIGGASFMLAGLLYVWAFVAQLLLPSARLTSEAGLLQFIQAYRSYFVLSYSLFTAANALSIVGVFAIYAVVRAANRSYALLGAGTLVIGLTTELLSSTTPSLVALSDGFSSAGSAADQQAFATAALAVSAANNPIIASAFIGVGVIFVSLAMAKDPFGRWLGYLGLVVGVFNIVRALPFLEGYSLLTGLLFVCVSSLWIFGVGRVVYKESR